MEKLQQIQAELKAPKNQYNSFGKYAYRSAEDILEAVKPLLSKDGSLLTISDEVVQVGGRVYVKAICTYTEGGDSLTVTAFAREPENKKGMDESQITGTASSYARKYALNGLFLIDDNKDPDTNEAKQQEMTAPPPVLRCAKCGREIVGAKGQNGVWRSANEVAQMCGGLCPPCYVESKKQ